MMSLNDDPGWATFPHFLIFKEQMSNCSGFLLALQGSFNGTHLGGIKQDKCMVLLMDFPLSIGWYYDDPCSCQPKMLLHWHYQVDKDFLIG